jgi:hypothetical protein
LAGGESNLVLFYTNDLLENPPEPMLLGRDERTLRCVYGVAKLFHWTGDEVLNQTDFYVAASIVANNMFMNGIDCMDQHHSTLAMQQKVLWLHIALFTYLLDLATCQAYAVHQWL